MTVSLLRVDDRLIHGQVIVGWGQVVNPHRLILIDDEVAADDWEADLYRAGVPDDVAVEFVTIDLAAQSFASWKSSADRTIVLVRNVESLERLCAATGDVRSVNLGGVHQDGHRRQLLPYVFLSDEEIDALRRLEARGVTITAQDLPNAAPVPLEQFT